MTKDLINSRKVIVESKRLTPADHSIMISSEENSDDDELATATSAV